MAVFINCFILCVWQFNSVRSTEISLPFTSIAYKVTPTNPTSLSLSFSNDDSMESKITKNFEDFELIKCSLSAQDEEVSKKTVFVSNLLSKLGSTSDKISTLRGLNVSKQKRNVDPNILYKIALPPQENVLKSRSNINEKYDVPKDLQNNKNTVYYNIKVISPPAVFNNLPTYLPVSQNVADSKMLPETYKYMMNVPIPLLPYPITAPTEGGKQESTTGCQNVRKTCSNNEDQIKYKIVEPQLQKNTINIAEHNVNSIQNIVKNEDIIVTPKANGKLTYDINKSPFSIDTRSNLVDYNSHQVPIKFLDTSYIQNYDILSPMSDVINIKQEIKPSVTTLSKHDADIHKMNDNMITFNDMNDIAKYYSVKNVSPVTPISYVSKETHISDIPTALPKSSPPYLPDFSKPQQIYSNDYNTHNLHLGSLIDSIVSYLTPKLFFALSDFSTMNSIPPPIPKTPIGVSEVSQPHITIDTPVQILETPVLVSTYPELELNTYVAKPDIDVPMKHNDKSAKKIITKSPVPYLSSVNINYMPCIETSNEIMIFV